MIMSSRTTITVRRRGRYGLWNFVRDVLGCLITTVLLGFPFWLIWIFVREMRSR